MRISIIHPVLLRPGGAENSVLLSAKIYADAGHDVHIFCRDFNPDYCRAALPAKLYRLREKWPSWVRSKGIETLVFGRKFGALISSSDVVICHNFPSVVWGSAAIRFAPKKPFMIWYCHEPRRDLYPELSDAHILAIDKLCPPGLEKENGPFFELKKHLEEVRGTKRNHRNRAWEKKALRKFDLIWCNSGFTAKTVESIYEIPVRVSYPPAQGFSLPAKKNPGRTVGVLASSAERKNFMNALRALDHASRSKVPIDALLGAFDPSELRDLLNKNFPALSAAPIVPTATPSGLAEFYSALDLHLFIPIDEPLGLLPTEAARFGVPSLLSDHGGPAELAELGFGRVTNPFDYRAVAADLDTWSRKGWPGIDRAGLPVLTENLFGPRHVLEDLSTALK